MRVVSLKINSNVYPLKSTNSHYLLLNTTIIPLCNSKISLIFLWGLALLLAISCLIFIISAWFSAYCLCSAILAFSSSFLAREDWDFLELPDDLLCPDSLLLEDPFDDVLSVSALLNQLWIFLLKVQTLLSKSPNRSSSPALSSSSSVPNYIPHGCLVISLNWASYSSTVILFLFERRRSSIMLHLIIILPLIFSLVSFNNVALYVPPFSVSFLLLAETPFTSFSSAWSLFGQVWSPIRVVVSLLPFDGAVSSWFSLSVDQYQQHHSLHEVTYSLPGSPNCPVYILLLM